MKVYAIFREEEYSPDQLEGLYLHEQTAEKERERLDTSHPYSDFYVEMWDVDETTYSEYQI